MSSASSDDEAKSIAAGGLSTNLRDLSFEETTHKTFVVDPKVFKQWNAGLPGTPSNGIPSGDDQSLQAKGGNLRAAGDGDGVENSHSDQDGSAERPAVALGASSGKKRKKKPKSKRGLAAPTGFEEFYVNPPLTPAEYDEELGLYDPDIDFSQRIECAVQRFCARRNMDSVKKDVFDKYLLLGGISAGPKQFAGGLDATDLSEMTAAEIAVMKAIHFVDTDRWGDDGGFEVDFEACVKAFISSRLPWHYDLSGPDSTKQIKAKTNIIRNFLNYLLHHDVCPEYKSQILAAQAICDLADTELSMIIQAQSDLPGDFQTACSEIFGGIFRGFHGGQPSWATDASGLVGIKVDLAQQTFRIGMSTHVSDEVAKAYVEQNENSSITTTRIYNLTLEITELIRSSTEVKTFYEHHPAAKGLKPLGRLVAKTWIPPYKLPQDLTPDEKAAEASITPRVETHSFLVEDYVLEKCFKGMKLDVTARELSFGLKFFDTVNGIYCSFYTLLPNELMMGWKIPEDEPLPAREKNKGESGSAEDFDDAEEQAIDAEGLRRMENGERCDVQVHLVTDGGGTPGTVPRIEISGTKD